MHGYLSYISQNTLESSEFSSSERIANRILSDLGRDTLKNLKFHDSFLASNKIKQTKLGQFHTPPEIIDLVLNALPDDFEEQLLSGATLVDPSCGTGNFLIAIVKRLLRKLDERGMSNPSAVINKKVMPNLVGIEIDPLMIQATKKIFDFEFDNVIQPPKLILKDALQHQGDLLGKFTFVVGNPPWVEVKELDDSIKEFVQDTYEVSNLYGAFILKGIELLKQGGALSYVVPRSFTGGRYFFKLRKQLSEKTEIRKIAYIKKRNQRFHGGKVLQELAILSICKCTPGNDTNTICVPLQGIDSNLSNNSFQIKQRDLFSSHDLIMILADSNADFEWIRNIAERKNLEDHGFRMSTGELVLHRSKDFLRETEEPGSSRVIYTHDIINSNNEYQFQKRVLPTKGRKPYAVCFGRKNSDLKNSDPKFESKVSNIENYCNRSKEIIIFRRRSHKGDSRRFVGVYLANELPDGFFMENGLNYIVSKRPNKTSPSLLALSRIFRSDLFERFFESISSNTQINKNDLCLFGIPSLDSKTKPLFSQIEKTDFNDTKKINDLVEQLYLISESRPT